MMLLIRVHRHSNQKPWNSDFQIHFHTSAKCVGDGKGPAGMIPLIHLCVHWTCGQNIWKRSNVCSLTQNPSMHGMWRTMLKYVYQDCKDYFFGFPKPKNYLIYSYGLIQCAVNGQNVCIPWVKPKDCCEETPCDDSIHIHLYIYIPSKPRGVGSLFISCLLTLTAGTKGPVWSLQITRLEIQLEVHPWYLGMEENGDGRQLLCDFKKITFKKSVQMEGTTFYVAIPTLLNDFLK